MRKDWKYILYLSLAFGVFVVVKLTEPREIDWAPTYSVEDKNPHGSFALRQILPGLFGNRIRTSNKTVYELKDSLSDQASLIILTHNLQCGKEDAIVLLDHVAKGATAFISAQNFYGTLADTLHLKTSDVLFTNTFGHQGDMAYIRFMNPRLDSARHYPFREQNMHDYFTAFDSTRTTLIAENDMKQPVTIRIQWGKGSFIFNSTPLAFTNYYILRDEVTSFIESTLSHLPQGEIYWTEYYSVGRQEVSTPLRFILSREPLAWAYYLTVLSILLFIAFEARRKQRIIPLVVPPANSSLEFVRTIGNMYYQKHDHKGLAEMKILYFFDNVRAQYAISPSTYGENFISLLSGKSGKSEDTIRHLLGRVGSIRGQAAITESDLVELNRMMEEFAASDKTKEPIQKS